MGNLEKIREAANLAELRVDFIEDFSTGDVDLIKRKSYGADSQSAPAEVEYIFTCRKKEEGGFFTGTEEERVKILERAIEVGFDYVDVELAAADSLGMNSLGIASSPLAPRNDKKGKVILSFHDFEKTPSLTELSEIKKKMKLYSADIMKFSTMIKDDGDIKVLFKFLLEKQDDEEIIVIGMGEKGRMTRVVAPLLGSYLTYASTEYSKSAEGQIDVGILKKLYNEFTEL